MRIFPAGKLGCVCLLPLLLLGQQNGQESTQKTSSKAQIRRIHDIEKGKAGGMAELAGFLKDPDRNVRVEAVKAIVKMGSSSSIDPLLPATRDIDVEVRVRATDGIVNVYLPGYVSNGYFTRSVRQVKSFFSSRNDSIIDEDVLVRDDVSKAIAEEIDFGPETAPRANASLAAGVLRLKGAVPALLKVLHSKNSDLIFESLVALQKIHDPSAGPGVGFLVRDLDEHTQVAALETVGVLGSKEAAPDVRYALQNAGSVKVRRAALSALAMLAVPEDHTIFRQYVMNGDAELRTAALEGLGRIREPEDTPTLQTSFDEANADWRIHLAAAFALVNEGNVSTDEFSPLSYLVETLNSNSRSETADAYLKELAHRDDVRKNIVTLIAEATKSQKLALCWIFADSHANDLLPALDRLGNDPDGEVSITAKRAAHVLKQQTRQTP
jgi:HEAT repeat protein